MKTKLSLKGTLVYKIFKNNILIEEVIENNLVVDNGRNLITHFLAGDNLADFIERVAFGTNGSPTNNTDSQIVSAFVKPISGFDYTGVGQVRFNWELLPTENNGMTIAEFGLISSNGLLFARRVRTTPLYKESDIHIMGYWMIAL
ncbi:MAG: hypothetical protein FWE02_04425 [Defluviitaleaceae bacterium]|nr:hypothetical protein [Defluviitaleaceae bacterium]